MPTNLVTVYKYLHGLINCLPFHVGLETATSSTRGCDIRLKQKHPVNRSGTNLFPFRAASTWNKFLLHLLKSGSVKGFKKDFTGIFCLDKREILFIVLCFFYVASGLILDYCTVLIVFYVHFCNIMLVGDINIL